MYICLLVYSIVSVLGVLAWWLSFDTLLPSAIGGIAGSIIPVLLAIFHAGYLLYKLCKKDPIEEDNKKAAIFLGIMISVGAAIGVVLNAGVAAILPNTVVGFTFIGATIGIIATITGFFATVAIVGEAEAAVASATPITAPTDIRISKGEEVDECITYPAVEKVFSAKETAV